MKKRPLIERLRAKKQLANTAVGANWYSEVEWARVKSFATDPELFEETYAEWHAIFDEAMSRFVAKDIPVEKMPVYADELRLWCQSHNCENDSSARSVFAAERMRSRLTQSGLVQGENIAEQSDEGVRRVEQESPIPQAGQGSKTEH